MASAAAPVQGRWSDCEFLDGLRRHGDPLADNCLAQLGETLTDDDFRRLFMALSRNYTPLACDAPKALKCYFEQARRLPAPDGQAIDLARLKRGQRVFMTHLFPAAMVLLMRSLPEGYAAPNLSLVLAETGNLERRTYRRLLGVLQMLTNVSEVGGFEPSGRGLITLAKVRLLHAAVRRLVRRRLPWYEACHDVPANHEDLLGTIMGFSYLVVDGLGRLDLRLASQEAEDFYYLWRVAALLMGIHPEDRADCTDHIPPDLDAAATFYASYSRRHYVDAPENADGVALARADLAMIDGMLPQTWLRRRGWKIVPRVFMQALMGEAAMHRVGLTPFRGFPILRAALLRLPWLWGHTWVAADRLFDPSGGRHARLSQRFLQGLIVEGAGGEISFTVPDTLDQFRAL